MHDSGLISRADALSEKLANIHEKPADGAPRGPGTFFGPIDEVGELEREFILALSEGKVSNPQVVAQRLVELGKIASNLLTDASAVAS
jgi:hypothetical protein